MSHIIMQLSSSFEFCQVMYQDDDIMVVQTLAKAVHDIDKKQDETHATDDDLPYGAFNLGLHVQDNANKVLANRAYLLASLATLNQQYASDNATNMVNPIYRLHWLNQVHGDVVIHIDQQPLFITAPNADAMLCHDSGVALAIMTADCVPICLHFVDLGMIACIHAGWQGLANGIITKTIDTALQSAKHNQQPVRSYPLKIQAFMGACIGGQSYEVDIGLAHKLVSQSLEHYLFSNHIDAKSNNAYDELFTLITQPHNQPKKTWLNIQALAIWQLEQIGKQGEIDIQPHNRYAPCSYADDAYYSHRRATHLGQGHTGRMAMVIVQR